MDRDRFAALVREALDGLPDAIARHVSNVDVVVEDVAASHQLRAARVPAGATLLGLYEGIPLTRRTSRYGMVPPDRIVIFQRPIERLARDDDDLVRRVRDTVVHEVAHHFGISDARLRQIETERRRPR